MKKIFFTCLLLIINTNQLFAESENKLVNIAGDMAGGGIDIALKIGLIGLGGISLIGIIVWGIMYVIKSK